MTNSTARNETKPHQAEQQRAHQNNQKPFYKHAHLWLVMIIPIFAVVVSSLFVYLAFHGKDDLVRDDWYMDGKTLEQDLSRDTEASLGQYQANIRVLDDGKITVHVASIQPKPLPAKLILHFFHATKANRDKQIVLSQRDDNRRLFEGVLPKATTDDFAGNYTIELDGTTWRLRKEVTLPISQIDMQSTPLSL